MNEQTYRAWRVRLRQVSGALTAEAMTAGASHEQIGVMEVLFDPRDPAGSYATPRHGTVWVSDSQVKAALDWLREAGGPQRVRLVDGLYPPRFTTTLRQLGLSLMDEEPLLLLPLAAPDDGSVFSARPVGETAALYAPGTSGWELLRAGSVIGEVRIGPIGGRAARVWAWSAQEPDISLELAAAAIPDLDLLFADAGAHGSLRELGFSDCGALLTFEAAP